MSFGFKDLRALALGATLTLSALSGAFAQATPRDRNILNEVFEDAFKELRLVSKDGNFSIDPSQVDRLEASAKARLKACEFDNFLDVQLKLNPAIAERLLEGGSPINDPFAVDDSGRTPLHALVSRCLPRAGFIDGQILAMEILLNSNVDINARDSRGLTALDHFVSKCPVTLDSIEVANYLLSKGAKPTAELGGTRTSRLLMDNYFTRFEQERLAHQNGRYDAEFLRSQADAQAQLESKVAELANRMEAFEAAEIDAWKTIDAKFLAKELARAKPKSTKAETKIKTKTGFQQKPKTKRKSSARHRRSSSVSSAHRS